MKNIFYIALILLFISCNNNIKNNHEVSENNTLDFVVIDFSFSRDIGKSQLIYSFSENYIVLRESKLYCYSPDLKTKNKVIVELDFVKVENIESKLVLSNIWNSFNENDFKDRDGGYEDGFTLELLFVYKDKNPVSVILKNFLTTNHKDIIINMLEQMLSKTNNVNNKTYLNKVHNEIFEFKAVN